MNAREAGFEEVHERQSQQPQLETVDPHVDNATLDAVDFRYVAIEGPIGVGKSSLAERLGARLDANVVLDDAENPFLADFYAGRPGAAFQAQLFALLNRHRQQVELRQGDLFAQTTVVDYLFEKDRIYAHLNLDDNELFIYQRLYELVSARRARRPTSSSICRRRPTCCAAGCAIAPAQIRSRRALDGDYVRELNEAYNHFFFHYQATPLLVVETSQFDPAWDDAALDDLVKQLRGMGRGTRYYVPRTDRRPFDSWLVRITICSDGLVQKGPQAD